MNYKNTNSDLIWKFSGFSYPEVVVAFLKRFESSFCVFSSTVHQLYSNYEMLRVNNEDSALIVLPNPFAHHDNYFDIPEEAILPTGMVISPTEIREGKDWILCYRDNKTKKWKGMSVSKGLEKFKDHYGDDDPFLPIILNSDLCKSSYAETPLMHLHRISIKKLNNLSVLDREGISKTINNKLESIAA